MHFFNVVYIADCCYDLAEYTVFIVHASKAKKTLYEDRLFLSPPLLYRQ